jgi:hypothetical protein
LPGWWLPFLAMRVAVPASPRRYGTRALALRRAGFLRDHATSRFAGRCSRLICRPRAYDTRVSPREGMGLGFYGRRRAFLAAPAARRGLPVSAAS